MAKQLIKGAHWRSAMAAIAVFMPGAAILDEVTWDITRVKEVTGVGKFILDAGDPSLAEWTLPPQSSMDYVQTDALVDLGRTLFFDKRLSKDNSRSCASCHRPELGWSDGRATAQGLNGEPLTRATPSLFNVAYAKVFMWDGRASSLEAQTMGPVFNPEELGSSADELLAKLQSVTFYRRAFAKVFPDQTINEKNISRAITSFEQTLIARNTRFDQWVAGDSVAMTASEIRGFGIFLDPNRGGCATCHAPPNFSDDGFHNIGLESFAEPNPDLGRYSIRPVKQMRGAFKTPSLRNIALTAPYFHDGSAQTLEDVIEHYLQGGVSKENLSPEMKDIELDTQEQTDLISFLRAISETGNIYSINLASEQ